MIQGNGVFETKTLQSWNLKHFDGDKDWKSTYI